MFKHVCARMVARTLKQIKKQKTWKFQPWGNSKKIKYQKQNYRKKSSEQKKKNSDPNQILKLKKIFFANNSRKPIPIIIEKEKKIINNHSIHII